MPAGASPGFAVTPVMVAAACWTQTYQASRVAPSISGTSTYVITLSDEAPWENTRRAADMRGLHATR